MTRRRLTETHGRPDVSGARILPAAVVAVLAAPFRLGVALAVLAALPGLGEAAPHPLDARVIWAHTDRVYVAAADSIALAPGDLLTLVRGRKTVATGEVVQVLARDLAAARLTSGSLERASHLDRLRVLAERPPLRAMALLRIGYPGRGRGNLLFECIQTAPRAETFGNAYRTDSLAENAHRMVRIGSLPIAAPWPDTILIRLFSETEDEEIALERGELDLAVFWPGEASSRLRSDARIQGLVYGRRSHGMLAAIASGGGARAVSADHPALAALNEELFRGDLETWRDLPGPSGQPPARMRFAVDPACPGRITLQRFLDLAGAVAPPSADSPTARLVYFNSSSETLADDLARYMRNGAFSSEARAWADTLASKASHLEWDSGAPELIRSFLRDSPYVKLLFTVRCAIALQPALRAYVAALGTDTIADLIECAPAGRAP